MNRAPDEFAGEQDDPLTATLNELADQQEPPVGGATGRQLIDAGLWTW